MCIGVGHFADLTVLMYGGEEAMVAQLGEENMRFDVLPFFCCFTCLPRPNPTKFVSVDKFMQFHIDLFQNSLSYYLHIRLILNSAM